MLTLFLNLAFSAPIGVQTSRSADVPASEHGASATNTGGPPNGHIITHPPEKESLDTSGDNVKLNHTQMAHQKDRDFQLARQLGPNKTHSLDPTTQHMQNGLSMSAAVTEEAEMRDSSPSHPSASNGHDSVEARHLAQDKATITTAAEEESQQEHENKSAWTSSFKSFCSNIWGKLCFCHESQ